MKKFYNLGASLTSTDQQSMCIQMLCMIPFNEECFLLHFKNGIKQYTKDFRVIKQVCTLKETISQID